jgi:coatomer subunit epsilon
MTALTIQDKDGRPTMTEPDELYTLRAQFWLGHYQMAAEEAKGIARRPLNPDLKVEREEFLHRSYLSLGQYDKLTGGSPGMYAVGVQLH